MVQTVATETCAAWVKRTTRGKHEAAEAVMMPLIQSATDAPAYGRLLQGMYGFYTPMEQMLTPWVQAMGLHLQDYRKAHLILGDLHVLQQQPPISLCTHLPTISNQWEALGALYVLEGASLGGRVIARMLRAHQAIPAGAFQFFEGHGQNTGSHWKAFIAFLDQQAQTPEQMEQVGSAADATFTAHALWMQTI